MKFITALFAVVMMTGWAAMADAANPAEETETATVVVTVLPAFPSDATIAKFRLIGGSGPFPITRFGEIGAPVTFSGLEPGDYFITINDFGGVITVPQTGFGFASAEAGETVEVEIQLMGTPPMEMMPLILMPLF